MRAGLFSGSLMLALACALPAGFALADGRDAVPSRSPVGEDAAGAPFLSRVTSGYGIRMTVTNYGMIGNGFSSRAPSLEYPAYSGFEHLAFGGLWVGAHAVDGEGPFTGVTTAAIDESQGQDGTWSTEYLPVTYVQSRSSLPGPLYDPAALSVWDVTSVFDDLTPRSPPLNTEPHRPLGIRVRQWNHTWSAGPNSPLGDIEFLRFIVTNAGAEALTDIWVGMYTEFVSGNKDAYYYCWPPSSMCGPGGWYMKAWVQWDGAYRLIREHYCAGLPVPDGCSLETVPYWIGLTLLTPPDGASGQSVTLAAWEWSPGSYERVLDVQRYGLMSAGTIQDLTASDLSPVTGDPVELLAVGPYATLAPGDSLEVAFAIVGGAEVADIRKNAQDAQLVHDLNYMPPVAVTAGPTELRLGGTYPNPFPGGELRLAVSLGADGPARLELLDIGGRRLASRSLDGYGRGGHVVHWSGLPPLAPAVYVIRLTQGGTSATRLITVLR